MKFKRYTINNKTWTTADDHYFIAYILHNNKFFGLLFLYKVPDNEMQRQLLLRTKDLISVHN